MNSTTKKINGLFFLLLVPLLLYGTYKNGFLVYQKELIGTIAIFKPIILVLISVFFTIIIDYIFKRKLELNFNVLSSVLFAMIVFPNVSYITFTLVLIISRIFIHFIGETKFNQTCFLFIVLYLIELIFGSTSFQNLNEANYLYDLSVFDILMGRGVGGISATSIILLLIIFALLASNIYYKKEIPITIFITYVILCNIVYVMGIDGTKLISSSLIFGSILVSPNPSSSPYSLRGMIIYGLIIAIITFIISFFNADIAIYIAILIVSIFVWRFDELLVKQKKNVEVVEMLD